MEGDCVRLLLGGEGCGEMQADNALEDGCYVAAVWYWRVSVSNLVLGYILCL